MNMKKRIILISLLSIIGLYILNQILYLAYMQQVCHEKITTGKDLNWYETASAMQMHTNLWLVGWLVEPNTAEICFCKQFHIEKPLHLFPYVLEDEVVIKAKQSLKTNGAKKRLGWKTCNTRAPILLNGATLQRIDIISEDGTRKTLWKYSVPCDFAPGIFKVGFIPISEGTLDYLEKKGYLINFIDVRYQEDNIDKPWYVRLLEKPFPISAHDSGYNN